MKEHLRLQTGASGRRFLSVLLWGWISGLRLMADVVGQPSGPADAQSTVGPARPPEQELEALFSTEEYTPLDYQVVISGVPAYIWRNGCGPTAAGMVIGYWDGHGFDNLVSGSAATQTAAVNAMLSSQGNNDDYCLPKDYYPTLLADKSQTDPLHCHADNSVADFMDTSRSARQNYYGWSWFSDVDDALNGYAVLASPQYQTATVNKTGGGMTWTVYCAEIDAHRPVVLLVDSNGDGATDHFVTGMGYGEQGTTRMYACRDTWDTGTHWYTFQSMAAGRVYGIYGAVFFTITQPVNPPSQAINPSPANGAANVAVNATVSWANGGGATSYNVYFGTSPVLDSSAFRGSQAGTSYAPGTLLSGRTYYWRIDSVNSGGTTSGQPWSFATLPGSKTLVVESMHGESAPESGSYNYPHGTILTNATMAYDTQSSTQYVCTGWAMAGCEPATGGGLAMTMALTNNAMLVWQWATNVWFDSGAGSHGHVEGASDGWYGLHSAPSVTAAPDPYYHFAGWQGDVAPGETLANPLQATLDRPRSVTALFAEDLAPMGTPQWWMAANGLTGEGFEIEETLDRDGDGMAAWQEWVAGTCPTDRLDRLCLVECRPLAGGQGVTVRWQSVAGRTYTVYRAASLAAGAWSNVYEIVGDGGLKAYADPNQGDSHAYFRIGVRLAD